MTKRFYKSSQLLPLLTGSFLMVSCNTLNGDDTQARRVLEANLAPGSDLTEHLHTQSYKEAMRLKNTEEAERLNQEAKERLRLFEEAYNLRN